MIRTCPVLAVDGTHNAGKSTLTTALADHYHAAGLDVAQVSDPARDSPLIAATVADPGATFDITTELDLAAATISAHIRAAAGRQLLVVDKTVANVLAYAHLLLTPEHHLGRNSGGEVSGGILAALRQLCQAWQPYDLVIHCRDRFTIDLAEDPFRAKVTDLQAEAAAHVHAALTAVGYPVIDLPTGLSTAQRLTWVTAHPALPHLLT